MTSIFLENCTSQKNSYKMKNNKGTLADLSHLSHLCSLQLTFDCFVIDCWKFVHFMSCCLWWYHKNDVCNAFSLKSSAFFVTRIHVVIIVIWIDVFIMSKIRAFIRDFLIIINHLDQFEPFFSNVPFPLDFEYPINDIKWWKLREKIKKENLAREWGKWKKSGWIIRNFRILKNEKSE